VADVTYVSLARVERHRGPIRHAFLPSESSAVVFGVHGAVASHYGITPGDSEPHATTIDYLIAAVAG